MPSEPLSPSREELARELLRYKMMEYSSDSACATWLVDLEWDLWNGADVTDPTREQEWMVEVSRECRVLGEIADGWWVYEDETRPGEQGPVFVPMERWMQILAERKRTLAP